MTFLSSSNLNQIAALYENIATSEQDKIEEMSESYIEEAPMTAFQAAGGQAKLDQINRNRSPRSGRATASDLTKQGQDNLFKAGGGNAAIAKGPTTRQNVRGGGSRQVPTLTKQDIINRGTVAAGSKTAATSTPAPSRSAAPAPRPASSTPAASRPSSSTPAAKPAAKVAPSTPAKSSGPAIGKLGSTSFERRTPTSAELKAAQSARASGASPEKALQAAKSAGGALSQATAAASKPAAFSPSTAAAKTAPTPKMTPRQMRLNMEVEYDTYDVVLEYLLSQGHAGTVEEAHYVMMEMDVEMIQNILDEERRDPRGRVSSGPMNVYRNPKGKPDQAHLDAVKSYDEKQKKKTPEQRKKELDDYIQRQRENK